MINFLFYIKTVSPSYSTAVIILHILLHNWHMNKVSSQLNSFHDTNTSEGRGHIVYYTETQTSGKAMWKQVVI